MTDEGFWSWATQRASWWLAQPTCPQCQHGAFVRRYTGISLYEERYCYVCGHREPLRQDSEAVR